MVLSQKCKRVSISSKRQITIPQAFFASLGFESKADCILKDNEIVIRPAAGEKSGIFAEQILSELIEEGYSGKNLLNEFKNRQAKARSAVEKMLVEADAVAEGSSGFMTMDEVFGEK